MKVVESTADRLVIVDRFGFMSAVYLFLAVALLCVGFFPSMREIASFGGSELIIIIVATCISLYFSYAFCVSVNDRRELRFDKATNTLQVNEIIWSKGQPATYSLSHLVQAAIVKEHVGTDEVTFYLVLSYSKESVSDDLKFRLGLGAMLEYRDEIETINGFLKNWPHFLATNIRTRPYIGGPIREAPPKQSNP